MSRRVNIPVKTTYQFLQVFNGILELTDKELQVLSSFIDTGETVNLCSPKAKKQVADNLGVKDPNTLNNYVKRLKDKGAITRTSKGYKLSKLLQSSGSGVITIQINDERHTHTTPEIPV